MDGLPTNIAPAILKQGEDSDFSKVEDTTRDTTASFLNSTRTLEPSSPRTGNTYEEVTNPDHDLSKSCHVDTEQTKDKVSSVGSDLRSRLNTEENSFSAMPKRKVYRLKKQPAGACGACNEGCQGAYDRDIGCMGNLNTRGTCDREAYRAFALIQADEDVTSQSSFDSFITFKAGGRGCTNMADRRNKKVGGNCSGKSAIEPTTETGKFSQSSIFESEDSSELPTSVTDAQVQDRSVKDTSVMSRSAKDLTSAISKVSSDSRSILSRTLRNFSASKTFSKAAKTRGCCAKEVRDLTESTSESVYSYYSVEEDEEENIPPLSLSRSLSKSMIPTQTMITMSKGKSKATCCGARDKTTSYSQGFNDFSTSSTVSVPREKPVVYRTKEEKRPSQQRHVAGLAPHLLNFRPLGNNPRVHVSVEPTGDRPVEIQSIKPSPLQQFSSASPRAKPMKVPQSSKDSKVLKKNKAKCCAANLDKDQSNAATQLSYSWSYPTESCSVKSSKAATSLYF